MSPDTAPYDALLVVSFGGPEKPEDVVPFLENVTRGRGIPRERLEEVGEHYFLFGGRSPINDLNRAFIAAVEEDLDGAGVDLPVFWGNRNWDPYDRRRVAADARRWRTACALPLHQRLLELLGVPAVPREPGGRGRGGGGGRSPAGPGAPLLQPPRVRGADGRRHPRRPGRAARAAPQRRPDPLRHALHPGGDERRLRPGRLAGTGRHRHRRPGRWRWRLRRPAPQRGSRDHRAGPTADRAPVRQRAGLLLALRSRRTSPGWSPTSGSGSPSWPRTACPPWSVVPIGFVSDHMEVVYDLDTEAKAVARVRRCGLRAGRHRRRRPPVRRPWSATWCSSGPLPSGRGRRAPGTGSSLGRSARAFLGRLPGRVLRQRPRPPAGPLRQRLRGAGMGGLR